ncbi:MAG: hypothetical protein HY870_23590 [Chloroflexi bacterium]|nr:hypothetical protein [Chloroflexota bacterium]
MNPLYQAVIRLQQRLSAAGIDSAVIGGIAVGMWARPRATEDADFKVLLERDGAQRLLNVLQPDYTPLQPNPLQALQRNGVLFVKDPAGIRIDLQLADVSLDHDAIQRAQLVELEPGASARVCTAEDLLIYKIISTRLQDQVDVENLIRYQGDKLDDSYVLRWLRLLEQALDDSTLIVTYRRLRARSSRSPSE